MKRLVLLLVALSLLAWSMPAQAAMRVDIYGPGQNSVNLALADPLTGPSQAAGNMAVSCKSSSSRT